MFDKVKDTIQQAGDTLKEQAAAIGEAAKEKGYQIMEQWISILPKLESYGLEITYFAISVSINPQLEVELRGKSEDFDPETIQQILEENKGSTPTTLVFTTVRTTLQMYSKAKAELIDPLSVSISVRLSPEIRVGLGRPLSC